MIDFSRAVMTHFVLHHVGNKGLGEELTLSDKIFEFKDDFVKETALRYFLSPFKTDVYHHFKGRVDISLRSVANASEDIFKSRKEFIQKSGDIATHLYNQGLHPKIPGGPLYVCYFKDVVCDGELVDAIGVFKTEKYETYLKLQVSSNDIDIDADSGISLNKLDKGCLIFNTEQKHGYKLSIIDSNNKIAECALYWEEDFLNAKLSANNYYHTKNFIDITRGFTEEILTEANNVRKADQAMILNKSITFASDHEVFNMAEFEKEVLAEPEVIEAFKDYKKDFEKRMDLEPMPEEFGVSTTAVKKNKKHMRTVVKLDKNFHIYIHAGHDKFEQGFDEEKGMKFYKLWYINEQQ